MAKTLTSKLGKKTIIFCTVFTLICIFASLRKVPQYKANVRTLILPQIFQVLEVNCNETVLPYPTNLYSEESWLDVGDSKQAYVVSAYHEEAYNKDIRILGVKTKTAMPYYCQLWYRNGTNVDMVEAKATPTVPKSKEFKYRYCYFICHLPNKTLPEAVSLVTKKCSIPENMLRVKYIKTTANYERHFTVCLSFLHSNYSNVYQLIEWLELNKILGAQKFVIYNYETTEIVELILNQYSKYNETEVVNWDLPMKCDALWPSYADIDYFGQSVALNDCLYRNKGISEYVVNIDIDEFIIPHLNMKTWTDIIHKYPNRGVYSFRNTLFERYVNRNRNITGQIELATQLQLVTLLNIEREKEYPPKETSKYTAHTKSARTMVTHFVMDMVPRQHEIDVSPDVGLLHHYRSTQFKALLNSTIKHSTDKTVITKYKKDLIKQVSEVWSKFKVLHKTP